MYFVTHYAIIWNAKLFYTLRDDWWSLAITLQQSGVCRGRGRRARELKKVDKQLSALSAAEDSPRGIVQLSSLGVKWKTPTIERTGCWPVVAPTPADLLRTHECTHAHALPDRTHAAVSRPRAALALLLSRRGSFAPMPPPPPPPLQHVHKLPAWPSSLPSYRHRSTIAAACRRRYQQKKKTQQRQYQYYYYYLSSLLLPLPLTQCKCVRLSVSLSLCLSDSSSLSHTRRTCFFPTVVDR